MPYLQKDILEEGYDESHMLMACILLNMTSIKQVRPMIWDFLKKYKDLNVLVNEDINVLADTLKPLGMHNKRANTLIKFAKAYLNKQYNKIIDLPGIGKYGNDSYEIFVNNNLLVEPTDKVLLRYLTENKR